MIGFRVRGLRVWFTVMDRVYTHDADSDSAIFRSPVSSAECPSRQVGSLRRRLAGSVGRFTVVVQRAENSTVAS